MTNVLLYMNQWCKQHFTVEAVRGGAGSYLYTLYTVGLAQWFPT